MSFDEICEIQTKRHKVEVGAERGAFYVTTRSCDLPSGKQVSIVSSRPLMQQRRHPTNAALKSKDALIWPAVSMQGLRITRVGDNHKG